MKKLLMTMTLLSTLASAGKAAPKPAAAIKTISRSAIITLTSSGGLRASFSPYGARLTRLQVPGRGGRPVDVAWGFDHTADYRRCEKDPYYGATIGRYGNRIGSACFRLDGHTYRLDANDARNSLHGGANGFHTKLWTMSALGPDFVTYSYVSPDGEGGYPGRLAVEVTYRLGRDNSLRISYQAVTDRSTVVNLTNHTFWNLNGTGSGTILRHVLRIRAGYYTPVDAGLVPTGQLFRLDDTPLDFRQGRPIGVRIDDHYPQLHNGRGYDHNYVLLPHGKYTPVADVWGDRSGIHMKVFTDQPGLQFYSGNFMAGNNLMRGARDNYRCGFCLETQHFPDSPNRPAFPSTVLRPGQTFNTETVYQFSCDQ